MAEEIGLRLNIEGGGASKTLKELKQEIKALSTELASTEKGTEAYRKLAQQIGKAKNEVKDLQEDIASFSKYGTFNEIANAGRAIAGGFAAATGAMALFGVESENIQKQMLKVQASIAIVEGIKAATEGWEAAQRLLNIAMTANPIGLIVTAFTSLVALVALYKANINGVTDEQKELTKAAQDNAKAEQKKYDTLLLSENSLKLQGKSEREILTIKEQQTQAIIDAQLKTLEFQKQNQQSQVDAAKRNREILASVINWMMIPLGIINKSFNKIAELVGSDLRINIGDTLSSQLFDEAAVKEKSDKEIAATQEAIDKLISQRDGFHLSIQKIDQDAAKKSADDNAAAHKRWLEVLQRIQDEANQERIKKQEEADNDFIDKTDDFAKRQANVKKKIADQELLEAKMLAESKWQVAQALQTSLSALTTLAVNDSKKAQEIQKKLAALQLAIDTAKGISGAVAQAQSVPFPANIGAIATGVAMVLANIAKAKQILSQAGASGGSVPSAGGGNVGGGVPSVPNPTENQTALQTNKQGQFTGLGNTTQVKAYVVESEFNSVQKKVTSITKKALFE